MFRQERTAWGKQHDPFFHGSDDGKVSLPDLKLLNGLSWTRHGHTPFDQSALRGGRLVEAINLEATDWKQ